MFWLIFKIIIAVPLIFGLIILGARLVFGSDVGEDIGDFIMGSSWIILRIVAAILVILAIIGLVKFVF